MPARMQFGSRPVRFSGALSLHAGVRVVRAELLIDREQLSIDGTLGEIEKVGRSIGGELLPFDGTPGKVEKVERSIDGELLLFDEAQGEVERPRAAT